MNKSEYRKINREVMTDTKLQYETTPELKEAVENSIERQYMVSQEDNIDQPIADSNQTKYVCSGKRSFEAAKEYKGKKTAVLNFANNHTIGGSPFTAGAQEESLCRCSTLLPCLEAMSEPFYQKHIRQFESKEINYMGNDDLMAQTIKFVRSIRRKAKAKEEWEYVPTAGTRAAIEECENSNHSTLQLSKTT